MSIKKILLFSFILIFIPFIIVNLFIKKEEIRFNYISNKYVRVYRENKKLVEKVPLEEYVYGVVSSEMPANFYDSVNSQVYRSCAELKEYWGDKYLEYSNKIKKAVIDTEGQYLVYEDKVILSLFFSESTGYTENSEEVFNEKLPYLRSVESKWDLDSPNYNSEKEFKKKDFYNKLGISYSDTLNITDIEKTSSEKNKKLKINNVEFSGRDIRTKLELRSTFFTFYEDSDKILIKTKGYGHGVGMSQYGANKMALSGYKYQDILKYYYTGVEIKKINN